MGTGPFAPWLWLWFGVTALRRKMVSIFFFFLSRTSYNESVSNKEVWGKFVWETLSLGVMFVVLYFSLVFPFTATLYFYSTTSQREILYFLLHYIYFKVSVTSYLIYLLNVLIFCINNLNFQVIVLYIKPLSSV